MRSLMSATSVDCNQMMQGRQLNRLPNQAATVSKSMRSSFFGRFSTAC